MQQKQPELLVDDQLVIAVENNMNVDLVFERPEPLKSNEPNPQNEVQLVQLNQGHQSEPGEKRNRLMPQMTKRRFSTAGGQLFSVNEIPRETGFDYLIKKTVHSNIIAQPTHVQNNFDPFVRIHHPPFALRGRKRSASVDTFFNRFRPLLKTIKE